MTIFISVHMNEYHKPHYVIARALGINASYYSTVGQWFYIAS